MGLYCGEADPPSSDPWVNGSSSRPRVCVRGGVGGINETSVTGISLPPLHMTLSGTSTALPAGGRCRTSMSLEPPEKKNDGPIACRMCSLLSVFHRLALSVLYLLPRPVILSSRVRMQCKRKTYAAAAALDTTTRQTRAPSAGMPCPCDLVACVLPVPAGPGPAWPSEWVSDGNQRCASASLALSRATPLINDRE